MLPIMIKTILAIFLSVQISCADEAQATVWTTDSDSLTISREAVSVPSVHILDDVVVHFQTLDQKIGTCKVSKNELTALSEVGDLDEELEPFFTKCNLYLMEASNKELYFIYDEIGTDRYAYAKAVKSGEKFFQRGDLEMCTSKKIPKELMSILKKRQK